MITITSTPTTTIAADTTELDIEQVLQLLVRVAEKQESAAMDALAEAAIEMAAAEELADEQLVDKTTAAFHAAQVAHIVASGALDKAEHELKALRGEATPIVFEPVTPRVIMKMAQMLYLEAEAMEPGHALELAKRGEDLRCQRHLAAYAASHHTDEG